MTPEKIERDRTAGTPGPWMALGTPVIGFTEVKAQPPALYRDFNWIAQCDDKSGVAATVRPYIAYGGYWLAKGRVVDLRGFASFTPGTCDWKDSLVARPEGA